MSKLTNPRNVLTALTILQDDLPVLVGEADWAIIGEQIQMGLVSLQNSTNPDEQEELVYELLNLIEPYEDANKQLRQEMQSQALQIQELTNNLNVFTAKSSISPRAIGPSIDILLQSMEREPLEREKYIALRPGGIGGAKSHKFGNFRIDFETIVKLASGVVTASIDMIDKPHPYIIAAGVLLTIYSLIEATKIELSEEQASVFWGCILARNTDDNTADEKTIMQRTNQQRRKFGLDPLTENQVKHILYTLKAYKNIESVANEPNVWRIIERYAIKE